MNEADHVAEQQRAKARHDSDDGREQAERAKAEATASAHERPSAARGWRF